MSLQEKVKDTIQRFNLLTRGDKVLVAVSGGPDSVALLHLLGELREEFRLHLEVTHLQHGIRGEEGRQDALFVANVAKSLALPFHLSEVDLPGLKSERNKGNLEQLGREERYRFFGAAAAERGMNKVATGHTRDDQVETLLMWLLRGSGRKGLGGMPPIRRLTAREAPKEVFLIRPLVEVSRNEILDYVALHGLTYCTDRTNMDSRPLRNWIRLHLLPQLRERIDSHLDERLAHLTNVLREEEAILEDVAREHLQEVIKGQSLLVDPLLRENKAMQQRLIRLWLEGVLGNLRAISFDHVEKTISFIGGGPPQGRLSIPRGELVKQYGTVRLEKRKQLQKPICYSYTLQQDGELVVSEAGMKLLSSRGSFAPSLLPENSLEAVFDVDFLPGTLTVRNFRRGDRFQPLGMTGHKKVKVLFIEKKVPLPVRRTLPLVMAGGEILWIPGYGRSEIARVGPETKEILRVKLAITDSQFLSHQD